MSGLRRSSLAQVDVLGVPICAGRFVDAVDEVAGWVERGERSYATFMTVHALMESQRSAAVFAAHRDAGLAACDGMPLVWASRKAGVKDSERVYGPDFMLSLCERAESEGWSSFFYGGNPGVADDLVESLRASSPD